MRTINAWYFGADAPATGQEWDDHRRQVLHVRTLKVLSHERVNGRNAYLCRVQVLSTEKKPENISRLK